MTTIVTVKSVAFQILVLMAYATIYGCGLAMGFWIVGKVTLYVDYYVIGTLGACKTYEERKERISEVFDEWFVPSFIGELFRGAGLLPAR